MEGPGVFSMDEAEFDKFAEEYRHLHVANIRLSGEGPEYFADYKIRDVARITGVAATKRPLKILDFGAGLGASVPYFQRYFPQAHLTCLDVSRKSLALGAGRFPGAADFVPFDGVEIPFPEGRFDLAFAACVFHHIPAADHVLLLRQILRVLKADGLLVLYEHNPFNPLTVRAVNSCPFDENAVLIPAATMVERIEAAGFGRAAQRYRVFFPHFLRALRPLESCLGRAPLGAQYYVVASKTAG
jgi:SAM-dependent methyltransferase